MNIKKSNGTTSDYKEELRKTRKHRNLNENKGTQIKTFIKKGKKKLTKTSDWK